MSLSRHGILPYRGIVCHSAICRYDPSIMRQVNDAPSPGSGKFVSLVPGGEFLRSISPRCWLFEASGDMTPV